MKRGDKFNVDTYSIKLYEGERVVGKVEIINTPRKRQRLILVYSEVLEANVLIPKKELKEIGV